MDTEEWRDVPDFVGFYQVSSLGNVRSCRYGNKLLKHSQFSVNIDGIGYRKVTLCVARSRVHRAVARLVAAAFHPNPENKPQVDHINRDPSDNRACNLRWVTNSQNCANARTRNPYGLKGIQKHARCNKYQAHIAINGQTKYIGLYNTPEEAHAAYMAKAIELHGDFWAN